MSVMQQMQLLRVRVPHFTSFHACTSQRSLDEVLSQLEENSEVEACMLLGSSATRITPWSDYDLLVVTKSGDPFVVEFSFINGRASDIILLTRDELARTLAQDRCSLSQDCDVLSWISSAKVAFSKEREFLEAPERAREILKKGSILESEVFCRWVEANHVLLKVKRYLSSTDTSYRDGLEIMLTKAIADLPRDYLSCRDRRWLGDKDAMEFLRENDSQFADQILEAFRLVSSRAKCAEYERLLKIALAPIGNLWPTDQTSGGWLRSAGDARGRSRWEDLMSSS